MEDLKQLFSENLIRLRTAAGWTQAELAERIHYSDKSVSKWERAEAIPDAAVLKALAGLFDVTVDYLLEPHRDGGEALPAPKKGFNTRMVILVALMGIWTVAMLIYAIFWILGKQVWLIAVAALPVTLIALLVFNSLWNRGRHNMWIVAALVFSVFLLIYCSLVPRYNVWQLFLVLVPAEATVFLSFHIRVRRNNK